MEPHSFHFHRPAATPPAGLVSSRTSLQTVISLERDAQADRRVKRLKRSVWVSGALHRLEDQDLRSLVCWFVTLTYKGIDDWQPDHISKATQRYQNWCNANGHACRYVWVAELQARGAVHYHLLAWLPSGIRMPHWDRRPTPRRAAFWPHGMTETAEARSGIGYLMKYLSKLGARHRFPKGLRLYGIAGLTKEGRDIRGWINLPEWAKRSFGVGELARRSGGLVVRETGEILEPAFAVAVLPAGLQVRQLRELPARFHDGPYSTWPRR